MGLHRAWPNARIIGVDIRPQPHYPFEFQQRDVMDMTKRELRRFDFVWASPPCQRYSESLHCRPGRRMEHPDLVAEVRKMMVTDYVIENVPGAPLQNPVTLCGLSFNLRVFRHREFEASFFISPLSHIRHSRGATVRGEMFSVFGHFGGGHRYYTKKNGERVKFLRGTLEQWSDAMGIDWMERRDLAQAIPPAYSEYIARQWSLDQAVKIAVHSAGVRV
jgi:DNA (cytosine-5)-methyltransferase 1